MFLTDTNSLMYKTEAESVYKDLYKGRQLFHFSAYPEDSKCYNNAIELIIEKLREEMYGGPIKRFVGLKCKIPS